MTSDGESTYDARISARVREIRLLRGLTQREVAEQIGIAQDVYTRYESNRRARGWPVSMLADVADALRVPFVALIPGERVVCQSCGAVKGGLGDARV
jgi:transcriptional regulator with XRE-family HTH domain